MPAFWRTLAVVVLAQLSPTALGADAIELQVQAAEMERLSEPDSTAAESRVAEHFVTLAGSAENSRRLVLALRNGYEAELMARDGVDPQSMHIYPVTGRLGLGTVFISLALAQQALTELGIDQPTPAEIDAALNGGGVVVNGETVRLRGVLTQHVDGVGWGRIAKSMGVRLGPVVASLRAANDGLQRQSVLVARGVADGGQPPSGAEKTDRADHPARPERPDRPDRPQRPDRPDRPGKAK